MAADLVALLDDPLGVAGHAGDAIFDRSVRPFRVADNGGRPLIDSPTLAVHEHVALKAIGQGEDDLATVVLEVIVVVAGAERMGEQVLPAGVAGEVVALPVDDVAGFMSFNQPIVSGDAGAVETRTGDTLLPDVLGDIDAEHLLQLFVGVRQLQDFVIERRPGRGGHEPVATDIRQLALGRLGAVPGRVIRDRDAVGVSPHDRFPHRFVPLVIAQVDPKNRLLRVDWPWHADLAAPRETVDELGQAVAVTLQLVCRQPGVVQMRDGEVAREPAVALGDFFQIGANRPNNFCGGNVLLFHGRRPNIRRARLDPLLDNGDIIFARSRVLFLRRHRVVVGCESSEKLRFGWLTGNHLLAVDELAQVEDVIKPALVRAILPVAAVAIGLENVVGLSGENELLRLCCAAGSRHGADRERGEQNARRVHDRFLHITG